MKNNPVILEHSNMMNYSRELVEIKTPGELNLLLYTCFAIFGFIFLALFTFKINQVIKVPGIVKTNDNTSEIHNVISGKITSINYKQNQFVEKGDLLFTIDDSQYKATMAMYREDIENTQRELLCQQTLLQFIYGETSISSEDSYISTKLQEYKKSISLLKSQLSYYKQQYDYQKNLPETLQNKKDLRDFKLQLNLYSQQLDKFIIDAKTSALESEKNLSIKLKNLQQELLKLEANNEGLKIYAPVSGNIQEQSSLNIGDYIFANQPVLKIIPSNNQDFKIEMYIPSKDIGEITEGMEVKYRLSAFPFYEYKGAEGKIKIIDPDIRQTNNKLVYCVYSDINKTVFQKNNGKAYNLRPGIEVDARIIMDKITIATYIFRKLGFCR